MKPQRKPPKAPSPSGEEDKPWLVFRYCRAQCFACNECGYFWGSGHDRNGQPAHFGTEGRH